MDYLGKGEVLTNTDLDRFVNNIWAKKAFCVHRKSLRSLSWAHEKLDQKQKCCVYNFVQCKKKMSGWIFEKWVGASCFHTLFTQLCLNSFVKWFLHNRSPLNIYFFKMFSFIRIRQISTDRKWSGREIGGGDRERSSSRDLNLVVQRRCMSACCPQGYWCRQQWRFLFQSVQFLKTLSS